jgi:hypothetical protein
MPAVLQRGPNLPPHFERAGRVCWPLDGPCREVTLLSDYRRDLVKQRKRVVTRLRWHLHELDSSMSLDDDPRPSSDSQWRSRSKIR